MGARSAVTNFFRLHVLWEPKRRVQGATIIKHAQACEKMSHDFTRQHAAARSCTPIHRCPSLRLLTCILGNEILFGILACSIMPAVTHIRQNQGASECFPTYCTVCRFSVCFLSSLPLILENICCFRVGRTMQKIWRGTPCPILHPHAWYFFKFQSVY